MVEQHLGQPDRRSRFQLEKAGEAGEKMGGLFLDRRVGAAIIIGNFVRIRCIGAAGADLQIGVSQVRGQTIVGDEEVLMVKPDTIYNFGGTQIFVRAAVKERAGQSSPKVRFTVNAPREVFVDTLENWTLRQKSRSGQQVA